MPLYYQDPVTDYWNLVRHVTLWDVSCEVQVDISGPDASKLVSLMTPRNISKCQPGQAMYIPLVDENGGMINDPVLLRLADDHFWLSLADADVLLWAKALACSRKFDVHVCEPDVSPLQLQGPKATAVAEILFGDWIQLLKYYRFRETELEGIPVVVSRTGWSNEKGYEIFLRDSSHGDRLWELIMAAGKDFQIAPAAPSQIKRMESGLLSYRNDMDLSTNPFEVGLGRFVDLEQSCDFVGKQALKQIQKQGIRQKLMGLVLDCKPVSVNEDRWPVMVNDNTVGTLTSSVYSPALEKSLGYALLPIEYTTVGQVVQVRIDTGEVVNAEVTELPFVDSRAK
jgi:aminomethyltransferase